MNEKATGTIKHIIEQGTDHKASWLLALGCIAVMGLVVRLHDLTLIGIGGNDTILYYALAEQWLKGNYVFSIGDSVQVFRPALLAFNALALKLLGHTDYAIKLANVLLDGVNIFLVALLAHLFFRRRIVVLSCTLAYAFLPLAIWSSRQELAHTCSTFLVLCACLCVWLSTDGKRSRDGNLSIFLTGGFVAAAALTHEDLIFLSLPLGLAVALVNRESNDRGAWLLLLRRMTFFASLPIISAGLIFFKEPGRVGSVVSDSLKPELDGGSTYVEVYGRFLWDVILGSSSAIFVGLVVVAIAYTGQLQWKRRKTQSDSKLRWLSFCLFAPIVFVALYAFFFGTIFPRGFLPLMPLLLMAVIYVLSCFTDKMSGVRRAAAMLTLAAIIPLSSLASYSAFNVANRRFSKTWAAATWPTPANFKKGFSEFVFDARYRPNYTTHWRMIHEALKDRVDSRHRLLVTPTTAFYYAGRRALQTDAYFGDDAVYLLDHVQESLGQVIAEKSIQTVIFTTGQNRTPPSVHSRYLYNGAWAEPEPINLAASFGFPHYSVEQEFHAIARFLQAIGAKEILPFPRESYESRHARVWVLP